MTPKKLAAFAVILFLAVSLIAASGCSSKAGPKYLRYSVGTEPETFSSTYRLGCIE